MALKIRLRQQGRTNRACYRVVVADARTRRDGKYVESVGWYNPVESEPEKNLFLDAERIAHWLSNGAQLSECVENLILQRNPEVVKKHAEKLLAKKAKIASKRKARKKAA